MKFFKLYSPPTGRRPKHRIDLYYKGMPLYTKAVFENDRYIFQLPLNLSDKMMTGDLYADLCFSAGFSEGPKISHSPTPVSLVLSDRYD